MSTETTYKLIGANYTLRAEAIARIKEQSGSWYADGGQTSCQIQTDKEYSLDYKILSTRRVERVFLHGKLVHEVEVR